MEDLLKDIRKCTICADHLEYGPRPVLSANRLAKIAIIGQAPGSIVHASGIPWDDKSGENLRQWLGVTVDQFYDEELFAIIPMGFCYPGKGKSGDLPPRPECAPQWHATLFDKMPHLELVLLIGKYAQDYYLGKSTKRTLTDTVAHFEDYLPKYFTLPHPSPRNNIWQAKNEWFRHKVIPHLEERVHKIIK
jgi:uracil-DNA glycosylase